MIAGGVESMSRAPFVMPKAESAFSRSNAVYDTTIGWRFINKLMKERYGVDSMPETAENVAVDFKIEREAQDRMALASQMKAVAAQKAGFFDAEIVPVTIPQKKGDAVVVSKDEHPRETSLEALAKLKGVVRPDGTVTAGNASGVNDGAIATLIASGAAVVKYGLKPMARIRGAAAAGVPPRIMGIGPAPATQKLLARRATLDLDREIADRAGDLIAALRHQKKASKSVQAALASLPACCISVSRSSGLLHTFIPRPPPPDAALMITG
jgi:acetyl-CoA C-acetyltransferase